MMPANIRTFIGIPVPETTEIATILRELKGIGRSVRPTQPEQLHLTLKFLGDTPRQSVPAIRKAISDAAGLAATHPVELIGLGAFPGPQRPSVLWAGIRPEGDLRRIASSLDTMLASLGFVPESRPWHPHLTLARLNGFVHGLSEFLEEHAATPFGKAMMDRVTLYQSETGLSGSRYTELASVRLRVV